MPTEVMFVKSVIQGILIAIAFSFIIMMITTWNVLQSLIAILCVAMVISSITAIMTLNGQELGVSESISVVTLIGFSIDYILHYSADYIHSKEATRDLKMRQAYRHMGVSILSGFFTTFGSGSALFTCDFLFFKKFGMTISLTVLFAFFIATFTFGAFMHALGP